jgi:hypothetical protein
VTIWPEGVAELEAIATATSATIFSRTAPLLSEGDLSGFLVRIEKANDR